MSILRTKIQWSKLKKRVESFFADSLNGRVELRSVRYRESHDHDGRGIIVVDGEEVWDFCSHRFFAKWLSTAQEIRETQGATNYNDPEQKTAYYGAYDIAKDRINSLGVYSQFEFYDALKLYCDLGLDEALLSDNLIVRSLSLLDRRLGKRRLMDLADRSKDHPLLEQLYILRCESEGIRRETYQSG